MEKLKSGNELKDVEDLEKLKSGNEKELLIISIIGAKENFKQKKNTLQYISRGLIKASQLKNVLIFGCNSSIINHLKNSLREMPNIILHDSTKSTDEKLKVALESLKQDLNVKHEMLHLVLGGEVDTIDSVEKSVEYESPCIFFDVNIYIFL